MRSRAYLGVAVAAVVMAGGTARAATIVYEGFEGGMPSVNWQVLDLATPKQGTWQVRSDRSSSPTKSAYCCDTAPAGGPYNHNMYAWLVYGPFDLSTAASATVTFDYWIESESGYDKLKYGYSTDGNSFSVYSISGDSGGWKPGSLDLGSETPSLLGEPEVWVCWIFDSDINNVPDVNYEGAYIDDILIEATYIVSDDPYEENDARNKPTDFTTGANQWLFDWGGAYGVQLDEDWYKIAIATGSEHVVIDAMFTHSNGNIDIQLVSGTGAVVAQSVSTTDNEQIDFTVAVAGTYYVRVYGANSGNVYNLRWRTIATLPDLTITNIQPSNPNPSTLETISVTVTVLNQGNAAVAAGSNVVLFKDRAGMPGVPDAGFNWNLPLGAVAASGTATVTFTGIQWAGGDPLTWRMYSTVDNSQVVAESNEANNVDGPATVVWNVPSNPDLIVLSVLPSDADPAIGKLIDVTVTVKNQGSAGAGSFVVGLFYNPGAAPDVGDTADRTKTVTTLAAGAETVVTFTGVTSASAVSWTMYAVADNGSAVVESDETNNVSAAALVTWHAPELAITAVTPSDPSPLIGATISVQVTVQNQGDADAGAFAVELFHNRAGAPSVGQPGDGTQPVAWLGIGASTTVTFSGISNSVAEAWSMYAIVDNGTAVLESNEANNVYGPTAVTWCAPDLVVTAVTLVPAGDPEVDDVIAVQVTVQNQGDAAASASVVELFQNKPAPPSVGQVGDGTQPVAALGVGASDTVTFPAISSSAAETWSMYAIADNGAAVTEGDETNNVDGPTAVTWRQADLIVVSITPSNSSPTADGIDSIDVSVVVRNVGNADATGPFGVGLYYNESSAPSPGQGADETDTVALLGAGAQTTVTFTGITNTTPETWSTYAIVDDAGSGGVVSESSEANNVGGPTSVQWNPAATAVDLIVVSVVPSNASPAIGEIITVTVTVRNQGDATAGSFVVGLFENPSSPPPSVGDPADYTQIVSSLGPDAQTPVVFANVTSSSTATWGTYAIVDNGNAVDEGANEDNNVSSAATVTWHAPDLVVTAVTPLPSADPVLGGTISVQVTIQNQGDAAAGAFAVELFHDPAGAPSVGDTGDGTQPVGSLGVGVSTTVTFLNVSSPVAEAWSMYAIVDNGSAVLESDEGNNVHGPTTVTWHAPDLIITAVTPQPSASPLVGDTITVDVTILNQGDANAGAFVIELFHNPAGAPSVGQPGQGTKSVLSLAALGSTTVTFTGIVGSVAETWSMYAIVDNAGAVTESDETNNVDGPTAVTWRQADLVVTAITPSNSSPTEGNTISVDVTVENQGNADAGSFDAGLFYDEPSAPSPGGAADQTKSVASLAAATSTTLTFTGVTSAVAGLWEMYAIADNKAEPGDVPESDETNNVGGPTTVVWAVAPKPDLTITGITPVGTPDAGGSITVEVAVSNQGAASAGSFRVDLFRNRATAPSVGETGDQFKPVSGLVASGNTTVTFTVSSPVPADWQIWAVVDTVQVISEELENNNVFGPQALTWTGADLQITAVTPSSADNLINANITVNVTVRNNGNADSGTYYLGLFYNCSSPPSVGDAANQEKIDSLAAGASKTVTFTGVTSGVPATWSMYAIVDNDVPDLVDEYNESNNVSSPAVQVVWRAPDLRIVSVTPSNSNPTTLQTIDVTVVVQNQGDAAAGAFDVGLFYDSATEPVPGASADETQTVSGGLAAGTQTTLTFTGIGNAFSESWSMYAVADNVAEPGDVSESDESNNVSAKATVVWGIVQPDLIVALVTVQPDADPAISDTIMVSATVENQGLADAGQFAVGLFLNVGVAPTPGGAADMTQTVSSLNAGKSTTVDFTGITNAVPGAWQTYAVADNGLALSELNETNNVSAPTTVTWHAPDLAVDSIAVSPNQDPTVGDLIDVTVTIRNDGDASAEGFNVALFYDSVSAPAVGSPPDESEPVASLAGGGATTTVTFTGITCYEGVTWSMHAIVDNAEAAAESNETNNVSAPTPVTWHGPNLVILSVEMDDYNPASDGTPFDVWVTVANQGDIDGAACAVGLFYDPASAPSPGALADDTLLTGVLAASGGQQMLTFTVSNTVEEVWQMWAVVDNALGIYEKDEDDNVAGPVIVTWGAPATRDLEILTVTPTSTTPPAPGTIDVAVEIRNNGTTEAALFSVGLYYDLAAPPVVGLGPDRAQVTSLAGGATTTVTFAGVTNSAPEVWDTYVLVDSGGGVDETDETNNTSGPHTITWGEPRDVEITAVVVEPDANPNVADTVTVEVTVVNTGELATGPFDVGLFRNEAAAPSPGDAADLTEPVTDLAGGASVTVTFAGVPYDPALPLTWTVYAAADNGLAVAESDETDNVGGPTTVSWRAADLEIISISPSALNPTVGNTINVDVMVRNNGNATANFDVALFLDEPAPPTVGAAADQTQVGFSLAGGGASMAVTFPGITSTAGGTWDMYAVVDNSETVTESDEANNVDGPATVTWFGPDLTITFVTPSDDLPTTGETIDVVVTVRNFGNGPSGSCSVGLFHNRATAPTVGELADEPPELVGMLAAGGGQGQVTFHVTNTTAETWEMWAIVDNAEGVNETDETNNVFGPVTVDWLNLRTLTITSPNGGEEWESGDVCQITWESDNLDASAEVMIEFSLDDGETWQEIVAATENDGVYECTIPDVAGTVESCLVRLTALDVANPPSDVSDAIFTTVGEGASAPPLIAEGCSAAGRGTGGLAALVMLGAAILVARARRNVRTSGVGVSRDR